MLTEDALIFYCPTLYTLQLPSSAFSLEHPVQYFIESRKVRGGEVDVHIKQEGAACLSGSPTQALPPGDQATNGMEFCDVSEKDLEGDFDDFDENMDCNS